MVCLQLGSNKGDRWDAINRAKKELAEHTQLIKESSIFETEAWGKTDQKAFYNQIVIVKTDLSPYALLNMTQLIEQKMGRKKVEHWGARIIDIDIIYYGSKVIYSPLLEIPHKYMSQRKFVLAPLIEVSPDWLHPLLKYTVKELLALCEDNSQVKRIEINVE